MEAALSDLIETAQSPRNNADRDRLELMIEYLKEEIAVRSGRRSELSAPDC
jgi:hypothetical protein